MGKIVWLASYPKSGNTWLRAFLHNFLRNPKASYDINRLTDFTLNDSHTVWFRAFDPRPGSQLSLEEVAALRPKVHVAMTKAFPDTVFVKTHNALIVDRGTPMISMEVTAGAIYIVRNPLDLVISHAHHYGLTVDEAIRAVNTPGLQGLNGDVHVYEWHGTWSENVRSWTQNPNPALHVIRYEDMLDAPHRTFSGVTAFLGLPANRDRIDRAIRLSSFKVLREQERRIGFIEKSSSAERFFREGTKDQWRRVLTPEQIEAVTAVHQEQMARFGYWPLPSG